MIGHDGRDGEIKIGALESRSERVIARQDRMKREG
jgi:hypothetical protein